MAATDLPREHLSAASVIYLLLFIFAGFPVIIYCGYQLRASWREQWLTLRQRPIIASFYILCALWLVHCLIYALRDLFPRPLLRFHTQIAGAIEAVLQNSIMLLFLTRAWLLHFGYHYASILASVGWQIMISPASIENNWYLLHRHTLGDGVFILKYIVFPFSTIRGIIYGLSWNLKWWPFWVDIVIGSVLIAVVISIMTYIYCIYPQFDDPFLLRYELKTLTMSLAAVGIIMGLTVVLYEVFYPKIPWVWYYVVSQCAGITWMLLTIVSPQRRMKDKDEEIQSQQMDRVKRISMKRTITLEEVHIDLRDQWQKTITTKHGYQGFASFLAEQFSVEVLQKSAHSVFLRFLFLKFGDSMAECLRFFDVLYVFLKSSEFAIFAQNLLFVTEYVQLKEVIVADEGFKSMIGEEYAQKHRLELPPELALSVIAEKFKEARKSKQNKHDEDVMQVLFYNAMRELYIKYIEVNTAPLEINISSRKRANIQSVFQFGASTVNVKQILNVMETAVDEIIVLITGAAMRYNPEDAEKKRGHFHVQSLTEDHDLGEMLENANIVQM